MKRIFFLALIFSFLSFTNINLPSLVGKWKGIEKREIGFLIFDKEGFATAEMGGQTMGGKNFMVKGRKCSLKYKLNTTVKPNHLDLIMTDINTKETRKMLCIVKFIDTTSFDIASNFSEVRPKSFTKENSIRLIKEN